MKTIHFAHLGILFIYGVVQDEPDPAVLLWVCAAPLGLLVPAHPHPHLRPPPLPLPTQPRHQELYRGNNCKHTKLPSILLYMRFTIFVILTYGQLSQIRKYKLVGTV